MHFPLLEACLLSLLSFKYTSPPLSVFIFSGDILWSEAIDPVESCPSTDELWKEQLVTEENVGSLLLVEPTPLALKLVCPFHPD